MASSRFLLASLLFIVLASYVVDAHRVLESQKLTSKGPGASAGINCGELCAIRCSKSSRPNLCKRACGTCCARCNCVPKGTYGNEDSCPCYATMTTHGGAHKCP
ncbi:uncharacterized protein A4U43_UnF1930 [Asparagus officinalis]|uniref:Uncharacterized protein n=1 Tax=Asparagus officinalis TaxID=4686 RepID=A0A1R3L7F2_ASPOF|nr:gibberellin-regulated protein 1-like [Asparagus officinalis]ONK55545.1 uncharacterized protein A4U43_UnF1930 [Asparagus officinalis]